MSWIEQDCERSESRTRIALDQSRELQSLASSTLSEIAAAAIFGRRSKLTRTDRGRRHRLFVFISLPVPGVRFFASTALAQEESLGVKRGIGV